MLNRATITGRLVWDPEIKQTNGGFPVVRFRLASTSDYKNKDGNRNSDYIDCEAWRATAEFVAKYFQKGSLITVDGRLRSHSWVDSEGNRKSRVSVVAENVYFGESARDSAGRSRPEDAAAGSVAAEGDRYGVGSDSADPAFSLLDDDGAPLPF